MSHGKTLYECYKKPSATKVAIWKRIEKEIQERGGYAVDVAGNCYTFSVRYMYRDSEGIEHLVHISPSKAEDRKKYHTAFYIDGKYSHCEGFFCTTPEQYERQMVRLYNRIAKVATNVTIVTHV